MKILIGLTYYRPHTSGLTIYAERLANGLAHLGHEVTVMTSRFDPSTPLEEEVEGVRIVRVPVAFRVSKGVIMPTIGFVAWREVMANDIVCLHEASINTQTPMVVNICVRDFCTVDFGFQQCSNHIYRVFYGLLFY